MFGTIATSGTPDDLKSGGDKINANFAAILALSGGTLTSGGSANAQTLTPATALSAYANGQVIRFRAGFTNTSALTQNVSTLGAKKVYRSDGTTLLTGGEVLAGSMITMVYDTSLDSGAGGWRLLGHAAPYFHASVSRSVDQTAVPDGVWTEVVFDVANINIGSKFNTTTGRYTPGVVGRTMVYARVAWESIVDGDQIGTQLARNGSLIQPCNQMVAAGAGGYQGAPIFGFADHDADDYLSIFGLRDGTGDGVIDSPSSQTFAVFITQPGVFG